MTDPRPIPSALRAKLVAAGSAGVIAIAGVLVNWYEGRVYKPYLDPVGILTVCEGITGPEVIPGKTYSDAECDALRDKHLEIANSAVKRTIKVPLNKWQEAALTDFAFNLGETKLASSTMAKSFNAGNYTDGCNRLLQWVNGRKNGVLVQLEGLFNRRSTELAICLGQLN